LCKNRNIYYKKQWFFAFFSIITTVLFVCLLKTIYILAFGHDMVAFDKVGNGIK